MKTLIIGANGKIGRLLAERCVKNDIPARAMVRTEEQQRQFEEMGLEAVLGDLEGDMSAAFDGCEQIVFSAGSGAATSPHKTLLVDLWGSIRAIELAEQKGIKQFIMVSSLKSCDPLRGPEKIRHYLVARHCADDRLIRSSLNYTLLRPGRLLDEPGTGHLNNEFDWSDTTNAHCTVSREDVANAIALLLKQPLPPGQAIDMIKGNNEIEEFLNLYR